MNARAILEDKGYEVATILPEQTIKDAMAVLIDKKVGSLVVNDSAGVVVGIITERDIFRLAHRTGCRMLDTRVSDVMTKEVIIALPDDELDYLRSLITENRIRHLPVMDRGKLLGLISIGDVLRRESQEMHVTVRFLREYIEGSYPR
jgi:CBS domain-containing protein